MASRVAVMNGGGLVQVGSPVEIYERPNSRFVADFVGAMNLFDGTLVAGFNALALSVPGFDAPIPLVETIDLPEGAAIALAVRPEKLRLSDERPAGIALVASVASIGYQGGVSIVHLTTVSGQALKAQMSSDAAAQYPRGLPVWVGWDPHDAVLIAK